MSEHHDIGELLRQSPRNWRRWGDQDEIGALNLLTPEQVLAAVRHVRSGKVFTLAIPIGSPGGDPVWPGRAAPEKHMTVDKSHFSAERRRRYPGDSEFADDWIGMYLQGSTQVDALGHMWFGDELYNGYPAQSTVGGLRHCSVERIAEHGIVGRGVLLDIARHRGERSLGPGDAVTVQDLEGAAAAQGVEVQKCDILLLRTGWIGVFYERGPEAFYVKPFSEPGLAYSPQLVDWFHEHDIVCLVTDTIANEITQDPQTGWVATLHIALMVNLGIVFSEIVALDQLADDCAQDGQWDFLYAAAPLRVVEGAGAPVNPIVIK
jgi:kynurenine formamidase